MGKRLIVVCFVLCLLCSSAFADEILFRGIPWGSTPAEVKALLDFSVITPTKGSQCSWEAGMPYGHEKSFEHTGADSFTNQDNLQVAGYDVVQVCVRFYYPLVDGVVVEDDKQSMFYYAHYMIEPKDVDGAYEDLVEKMTTLYGEGVVYNNPPSDGWYAYTEECVVWYGDNNTGARVIIRRYKDSSTNDDYIIISYGKTDSLETLTTLKSAYDAVLIQKEREERENHNMDGL